MDDILLEDMFVQVPNELIGQINELNLTCDEQMCSYSFLVVNALLCKYGLYYKDRESELITIGKVMAFLGYKNFERQRKLIKKNGLLEQARLIEHVKDIPLGVTYSEEVDGQRQAKLLTSKSIAKDEALQDVLGLNQIKFKRFTAPLPTFLIDRENSNGTLSDYANTHKFNANDLLRIVHKNKAKPRNIKGEIFTLGLLKYYAKGNDKITLSGQTIEADGIMSQTSFSKYSQLLEKHNIVDVEKNKFDEDKGLYTKTYFL